MNHVHRYPNWENPRDKWSHGSDEWADTGHGNTTQSWNNLQDELESLLDQVHLHTQSSQFSYEQPEPNYDRFSPENDYPTNQTRPLPDRHSQALASVKRAMDRFSEPQEAHQMPAQSQHQLQNAIRQIRSSQRGNNSQHQNPPQRQQPLHSNFNNQPQQGQPVFREPAFQQPSPRRAPRQRNAGPREFTPRENPNSAQFDGFALALDEISSRLEQFEHNFSDQQNSDAAVADMATQVEQLSSVVEHLANNIGERGQIKRLENQIAKMADAIPTGADLDFKSLNKRLDVLSGAFEKLRDLQAQQIELNIKSNEDVEYMDSIETGVRNIYERLDDLGQEKVDLTPIESSVRSVYDRIDALEQTMAMPTPAIERLSREMADFTRSMRDEDTASLSVDLIAQVGGLVSRIEQIETEGTPVSELKIDMAQLQSSVEKVMEPRFAALENKIGGLSGKLDETVKSNQAPDNAPIAALEEHLKGLAQKLDKTSSDLNGLQEVFAQTQNNSEAPNINAIADIVAQRTSQAIEQMQENATSGVEQGALDQLESRLTGLFDDQKNSKPTKELGQVQNSINQVNQRLAHLEQTLSMQSNKIDHDVTPVKSEQTKQQIPQHPSQSGKTQSDKTQPDKTHAQAQRARHPGLAETPSVEADNLDKNWEPAKHLIPELRDNMPHPPAQDRPLRATIGSSALAQEKPIPVPASLRVDPNDLQVMESEVHELDDPQPLKPVTGKTSSATPKDQSFEAINSDRIKLPEFNGSNVTPPPAPTSDFARNGSRKVDATTGESSKFSDTKSPEKLDDAGLNDGTPSSPNNGSRSTFIEAARRAAQSNRAETEEPGSQSIIARAMNRFQKKQTNAKQKETDQEDVSREFPGDKGKTKFGTSDIQVDPIAEESLADENELDDLTTVPESFLTRHRQPILLVATVVAVGLLTLNLFNQRFSSSDPAPANAVSEMSTAIAPSSAMELPGEAEGSTPPSTSPNNPNVRDDKSNKPSVEDAAGNSGDVVGSIDQSRQLPSPAVRQINQTGNNELPSSLEAPAHIESASLTDGDTTTSLAGLRTPPEAVGPALLRQTATDGDPHAQFEVAAIFAEGRALPQDLAASAVWYERAAAQGFAPASYRLANMLENGVGVEKNLSGARLWYQLAADAGNRMSMHNLASLLASGQLGEPQFDAAVHWFEGAASLGLKDSQFNLGMLYARGLGVTQSLDNSFKWFAIAAKSGDEDAAKARDDIARSLDPQVVADLQKEVLAWEPSPMNIRANFAPIGTWSSEFDPGPEIDSRDVILKVQAALNGIGFDTGIPDGLIGPKTIEAISGFETQTGMTPSGKVNPRLLAVLGSQPV